MISNKCLGEASIFLYWGCSLLLLCRSIWISIVWTGFERLEGISPDSAQRHLSQIFDIGLEVFVSIDGARAIKTKRWLKKQDTMPCSASLWINHGQGYVQSCTWWKVFLILTGHACICGVFFIWYDYHACVFERLFFFAV